MQAGDLRRRVTLQRASTSASSTGERQTTWSDVARVWAAVEPSSGAEPWGGQQQAQANVTHVVTTRVGGHMTFETVTPKDRFLYNGRVLEIVAVRDLIENGQTLVFDCMEKK